MLKLVRIVAGAALVASVAVAPVAADDAKESHLHIGHVLTGWNDTPEGRGLLPTAIAEAEIAVVHAGLALQQPDKLDWLKLHTGHVMHAVDAGAIDKGPGLGYGVRRAADGVAKHVGFAAASGDASENVQLHAGHVATSAGNVITWVDQIVDLARQVEAATSAEQAAALARQIETLSKQLLDGVDANGDGNVTWVEGEGGLGEAEKHMGFMTQGEGLS